MRAAWGEDRLGIAWVRKHPDSKDTLCRGWDGLGRLNPAVGNEGMHRARKQRAYIVIKGKNTEGKKKTDGSDHTSASTDSTLILR